MRRPLLKHSVVPLFLTLLATLPLSPTHAAPGGEPGRPIPIEVTVGEATDEAALVEASGLTPEGEALWTWLERRPRGAWSATDAGETLLRADAEGRAVLERPEGVANRALFLVVDLATGEVGAGTPTVEGEAYEPELRDLPPGAWVSAEASGGRGALLRLPGNRARAVLVRSERKGAGDVPEGEAPDEEGPARGAWWREGTDGNEADEDGTPDGVVETAVASFAPVELEGELEGEPDASPPPERLRPTDLLVVFDLESLAVTVSTVGRGAAPKAAGDAGSELGLGGGGR